MSYTSNDRELDHQYEIEQWRNENTELSERLKSSEEQLTIKEAAFKMNIMIQQKQIARLTDENLEMKEACQELAHALLESAVAMFGLEKENEELKLRLNNDNL